MEDLGAAVERIMADPAFSRMVKELGGGDGLCGRLIAGGFPARLKVAHAEKSVLFLADVDERRRHPGQDRAHASAENVPDEARVVVVLGIDLRRSAVLVVNNAGAVGIRVDHNALFGGLCGRVRQLFG